MDENTHVDGDTAQASRARDIEDSDSQREVAKLDDDKLCRVIALYAWRIEQAIIRFPAEGEVRDTVRWEWGLNEEMVSKYFVKIDMHINGWLFRIVR